MNISVALVEPEHEVNVGHIARLMKNFGLRELLLIKPSFDLNKAKVFATHGKDLLEKAKQIKFNELKRFDLLIGTTAIPASSRLNLVRDSIDPEHLVRILANKNSSVCLVMGREATGLTNEELAKCDIVARIDTPTQYTTLNISHALAILLYAVLNKNKRKSIKQRKNTALKKERKLVIDYALGLAKTSGLRKYKTPLLEIALKRILGRSTLTSKEAMLMVSLFRSALLTMKRKARSR